MSDGTEQAANRAANAVSAVVENVEAGAAAAIEAAETRAANAEAAAASIADAAIRTELSQRIDDIAEDILECREENQTLRTELASLSSRLTTLETAPPPAPTVVVTEPAPNPTTVEPEPLNPPPSPQVTVISPSGNVAAVPQVAPTKPSRFRLT
jgi:hypothetical protein